MTKPKTLEQLRACLLYTSRNLNCCIIGSSGSGKTRFWLTPQLLQAHSSYVVVDPKGGVLGQVGAFLQKRGYKIKDVYKRQVRKSAVLKASFPLTYDYFLLGTL